MPKAYGEYVWVEEVRGDLSNRGNNRVVRVDEGPPRPVGCPLYRSVYLSGASLVEYVRAHKGPENPSGIRGFRGPCTAPFVPFDIDRELRNEKVADWPQAVHDSRQLLNTLAFNHGVSLSTIRCSLTGGRGIHLYLPAELFGGFEPAETIPEVVKAVALEIAREAGVPVDEHIYDRNRLLRVPNSRHPSGKYCVPVYAQELLNLDINDLLALMEGLRPDVTWVGEGAPVASLVELREARESRAIVRSQPLHVATPVEGRERDIVAFLSEKGIQFEPKGNDLVIRCPTGKHEDSDPSLGIDRETGKFHCFGCGVHGNWRDCQRLLHQCLPTDEDEGRYGQVAQEIYGVRQKQSNQDRRKDFEINNEVTSLVLRHLQTLGRFYTDGRTTYYFFETEKRLIEVNGEDDGLRILLHRYGINPTEAMRR